MHMCTYRITYFTFCPIYGLEKIAFALLANKQEHYSYYYAPQKCSFDKITCAF